MSKLYTTIYGCGHQVTSNVPPAPGVNGNCPKCAADKSDKARRVRQATGLLAGGGDPSRVKL